MNIGPQSQLLYRALLKENRPVAAKTLADILRFYPNVIYRLAKPLIAMGLISQTETYPVKFMAKPVNDGLSLFLLHQNGWFSRQFIPQQVVKTSRPEIGFIQGRDQLFNLSVEEINKTTRSIDLLRSGREIPADVMLALHKAKARGVITRMLIQDFAANDIGQIKHWRENGILVKQTDHRQMRLMIYDSSSLYFMSFTHLDSQQDQGMKIIYPPFAAILAKLFDQWWKEAKIIK